MEECQIPVNCPSCGSDKTVKDGSFRGVRKRLCKECGRRYSGRTKGASAETKRFAVHLYIEGMGLSAIGRVLNRSPACILYWIREAALNLKAFSDASDAPESVPVIELDEVWHFVKKNSRSSGFGLLLTQSGESRLLSSAETETKNPAGGSLIK